MLLKCLATFGVLVSLSIISDSHQLQVRLRGSVQNVKAQGRIEIFYNKTWGTVCENGLNDRVCVVVCRQLGLSGGLCVKAENDGMCVTNNRKIFSEVRDSNVPVWTGNVECTGYEEHLGQCLMTNFGEISCGHQEDGGCICGEGGNDQPGSVELNCNRSRHRIRSLGRKDAMSAGVVEVQGEDGQWGVICDDGWDDSDAFVFCSCLGFKDPRFFKAMIHLSSSSSSHPSQPVLYSQVNCDQISGGNIWDCNVKKSGFVCDPQTEVAEVTCSKDIFQYEEVHFVVESSCDGSQLEACFNGLDRRHDADHFFIRPECDGVRFVRRSEEKVCFKVDMLTCYPFRIKNTKGVTEMCYDVHYQNVREFDNSLRLGASWLQGICCLVKANASVFGSFVPLQKAFESVKTDNKNPSNLTMECFPNNFHESNDSIEFPAEVHLGSPVACYIDLSTWNTGFLLTVPDCFFLADPNDDSTSFQFLQDKCITSSHLEMEFFSPSMTRWGFRFKVPMFENRNSLYIMCRIHLCDPAQESKQTCDRSCWTKRHSDLTGKMVQKRKRRDVNQGTRVDGGPFVVLSGRRDPLFVKNGSKYIVVTSQDKFSSTAEGVHPSFTKFFISIIDCLFSCLFINALKTKF